MRHSASQQTDRATPDQNPTPSALLICVVLVGLLLGLVGWLGKPNNPHQVPRESKRTTYNPHDVWTLPNHRLTPGATDRTVTATTVCTTKTADRRNVSDTTKQQVYTEYGLPVEHGQDWEVDHLVPLELGGSNDITNLWPEPGHRPNPKDALENRLHALVCDGTISLRQARQQISSDWVTAYNKYIQK